MPKGVEVLVEDGFATIDFVDRKLRGPGVAALLEHTPAELIEKLTRSGPRVQYRVPEGNASAAGLLDKASTVDSLPNKVDLGHGRRLVEADPNAHGEDHWHHQQITVAGNAYVNGRDGANGAIQGPLRPNKPVADPPPVPPGAAAGPAELQAKARAASPSPADYAPSKAPRERHAPGGQATIATVVTNAAGGENQISAPDTEDVIEFPEGEPSTKWARDELDAYALKRKGLDTSDLPNKGAVVKAIVEG